MKKIYKYLIELGSPSDGDEQSTSDTFITAVDTCFQDMVSTEFGAYDEYDVTDPPVTTPAQIVYNRVYNHNMGGYFGLLIKSVNPDLETRYQERASEIQKTAKRIASAAIVSEGGGMLNRMQELWSEMYNHAEVSPVKMHNIDTTNPSITTQQSGGTSNTKTREHEDVYKTTGTARPTAEKSETSESDTFSDTRRTITTYGGQVSTHEEEYHDMTYEEATTATDSIKKIGASPFERVANKIIAMLVPMDEADRALAEARGSAWWGSDDDLIILQ